MGWNFRKLMPYLKSASSNLLICKISSKNKKKIKLVTKISILETFKTFNQTYETFNQHPRIWETINFHSKQKNRLGTKKALFALSSKCVIWVFWAAISKSHCHICNQHPRICLIASLGQKIKILKIWEQKCQISVFWGWDLKIFLSYLKPAFWNLS